VRVPHQRRRQAEIPADQKVRADRKKKQAVILSEEELDEQSVKETIDATGYTFLSFSSEEYRKKGLFGF
jgi:hypothetical protein